MIPERKDPYATLIESFLQNTQQLPASNEQRFVRQREERMVEEERQHQDEIRAEQYARQDSLEAQRRKDALTDQANQTRAHQAELIRASMPYLDPDSEEYARAKRTIEILLRPSGLEGQEAFNQAMYGVYEDDELGPVNTYDVASRLEDLRRDFEADEVRMQANRDIMVERLIDDEVPIDIRREYWNTVVRDSNQFTDDMKRSILATMGYEDRATIDRIILQDELLEIERDTARRNLDYLNFVIDREAYGFEQEKRLSDINYETAQEQLNGLRVTNREAGIRMAVTEREAFLELGLMPDDPQKARQMARDLGYDNVEMLRGAGQAIYRRRQEEERLGLDIQRRSYELLGKQVEGAAIANMQNRLLYERDKVFGEVRERINLAEIAGAAAVNGDVGMIQTLMDMQATGEDGGALAGIRLDTLLDRAKNVLGDEEALRVHQRWVWEQDQADRTLMYETSLEDFVTNIGTTRFTESDWEPTEDGTIPAEQDIQDYLDNLAPAFFDRIGIDKERLGQRLTAKARMQHLMDERSAAERMLIALENSVPHAEPQYDENDVPIAPGPDTPLSSEQQVWKRQFLDHAAMTEMDPEVAEMVADGMLRGENMDYWSGRLNSELVEWQIQDLVSTVKLRNAKAEAEGNMTLEIAHDQANALRQMLTAEIDWNATLLNSGLCMVTDPYGGRTMTTNRERINECESYRDGITAAGVELDALNAAYRATTINNLDPWLAYSQNIDNPAPPDEVVAPPVLSQELLTVDATIADLEGVLQSDYFALRSASPADHEGILRAWQEGVISTPEEVNQATAQALAEARASGAMPDAPPTPERAVYEALADRTDMRVGTRTVGEISNTPAWMELVRRVAEGEVEMGDLDNQALAREHGFFIPMRYGIGGGRSNVPDTAMFESILRDSVGAYDAFMRNAPAEPEPVEAAPAIEPSTPEDPDPPAAPPPQEQTEVMPAAQRPMIFIDPGHGTPNSAGISQPGAHHQGRNISEREENLTTAQQIAGGLDGEIPTMLGRTGELGDDYDTRMRIAAESGAAAYVGIHHDSPNLAEDRYGVYHNDTPEGIELAETIAAAMGPKAWVASHTTAPGGGLYIARYQGPGVIVEMGRTGHLTDAERQTRVTGVQNALRRWTALQGGQQAANPRSGPPQPGRQVSATPLAPGRQQ